MKQFLLFVATMLATTVFAQSANNKTSGVDTPIIQPQDTALRIIYANDNANFHKSPPAIFINGQFINNDGLKDLNPQTIANIDVVKRDTIIDKIQYRGQIYIKTKDNFTSKEITLTDLKNKYTNLKDKPAIFTIDGSVINANYDKYSIDENSLLTIVIDNIHDFQLGKEKMDIGLIKILTKTDENIKARKQIWIRGTELTMAK